MQKPEFFGPAYGRNLDRSVFWWEPCAGRGTRVKSTACGKEIERTLARIDLCAHACCLDIIWGQKSGFGRNTWRPGGVSQRGNTKSPASAPKSPISAPKSPVRASKSPVSAPKSRAIKHPCQKPRSRKSTWSKRRWPHTKERMASGTPLMPSSQGFPRFRSGKSILTASTNPRFPASHPWDLLPRHQFPPIAGSAYKSVASPTDSGARGVAIVGKLIFSPSRGTPGLHQGTPLPSNPSWEDSHLWETSFSSRSRGSPVSWVPLPINYFWEAAHLWEMLPPAIPLPATYPGRFATPPLFVPLCMHLFIANIFNL